MENTKIRIGIISVLIATILVIMCNENIKGEEVIKPELANTNYQVEEIELYAGAERVIEEQKEYSEYDQYLLAKIAMAEAEGTNLKSKQNVIAVVLNRVKSEEFPNTIKDVIFQDGQFSPINNGRWDKVEPDFDSLMAMKYVISSDYDVAKGALYFETCTKTDNWHSRNLEIIEEIDGIRFYK